MRAIVFAPKTDLHAIAVRREFERRQAGGYLHFHEHSVIYDLISFLEMGRSTGNDDCVSTAIWWRRNPFRTSENANRSFAEKSRQSAAIGLGLSEPNVVWVSDPHATDRASMKAYQISEARKCGLRVPCTLVTDSPASVREFSQSATLKNRRVLVKNLETPDNGQILTPVILLQEHLADDSAILAAPLIYQELIEGSQHLRVNVFGKDLHTIKIESRDLDWRLEPGQHQYSVFEVTGDFQDKCRNLISALNLRMGVLDFKIDPDGRAVFLEINPQGQFLFWEPILQINLAGAFVDFLNDTCE